MLAAAFVHNPIHGDRRLLTLTSASPCAGTRSTGVLPSNKGYSVHDSPRVESDSTVRSREAGALGYTTTMVVLPVCRPVMCFCSVIRV